MERAFGYMRTSSASNVGVDKDSEKRQRAAIEGWAGVNGVVVERWFYDPAVSGADDIGCRPGFVAMLGAMDGCRTILVESASRFARDVVVQELGYRFLKGSGIKVIAVDAPETFTANTPTQNLVRQVLGAVAGFQKDESVLRLKVARDRRSAVLGRRVEGRKGYRDTKPELVAAAQGFRGMPLLKVSERLFEGGWKTEKGKHFSASQVKRLLEPRSAAVMEVKG